MRIWYISHYAVPGSVSPGWRCHYVAKALAAAGHEVTVWAARCHHVVAMPCGRIPQAESREEGGYGFKTVPAPFYKGNGLGRLLNMLAFSRGMAKILKSALRAGQAPDLTVISSPHFFVWAALSKIAAPGVKMIFEERDIWPESMMELAGVSPHHPLVWYMKRLMVRIARRADGVISLLPGTEGRFRDLGLGRKPWLYVPNGVDLGIISQPVNGQAPSALAALEAVKTDGKLVVLYAGSMGPPNALEGILTLSQVSGEKNYKIFLLGDGVSRPALEKRVRDGGLNYIEFLQPVSRTVSWQIMRAADVGYHSLRAAEVFRFGVSPNKIFDNFALEKPVISSTNAAFNPVVLAKAGLAVSPGEPEALDRAFRLMADMPHQERLNMGRRGRDYVMENHDWSKLGSKYADFCENIVNSA